MSILANLEHADAIVRKAGERRITSVYTGPEGVTIYAVDRTLGMNAAATLGLDFELDVATHTTHTGTFRGVRVCLFVPIA